MCRFYHLPLWKEKEQTHWGPNTLRIFIGRKEFVKLIGERRGL